MLPKTLEGWSLEVLNKLLEDRYVEDESLDYKEALPHKKNDADKDRLVKTCAGFANGQGGFLVIGVKDDANLAPTDRIVGVEVDTLKDFGNFPAACEPTVPWQARKPPILLPSGRVVHVIEIPRSWKAPHAVEGKDRNFQFPIRMTKGNELMPYTEVQRMFLGFYEKRIKLQLLRAELVHLQDVWSLHERVRHDQDYDDFRPVVFDLTVLETVLADTFSMIADVPEILPLLNELRMNVRRYNSEALLLQSQLSDLQVRLIGPTTYGSQQQGMFQGEHDWGAITKRRKEVTREFVHQRSWNTRLAIKNTVDKLLPLIDRVLGQ